MSVKLTDKQLEKILSVLMPISENRFLMVADTNKYELIPVFNTSGTISEIKLITNGGKPDVFVLLNRRLIRRKNCPNTPGLITATSSTQITRSR
jgi:hypothetical protein